MPKKKLSKESSHKRKRSPSRKRKSPPKDIIGNLPEELIARIAFFLPTEDVQRFSEVNRLQHAHLIPVLTQRKQLHDQMLLMRARLNLGDLVEYKGLPFIIKKINKKTVMLENIQDNTFLNQVPIEEIIMIERGWSTANDFDD